MNILLLTPDASSQTADIPNPFSDWARLWTSWGHEIRELALPPPSAGIWKACKAVLCLMAVGTLLKRPDVLLVTHQHAVSWFVGWVLSWCYLRHLVVHASEPPPGGMLKPLQVYLGRRAAVVTTTSAGLKSLLAAEGLSSQRIVVIASPQDEQVSLAAMMNRASKTDMTAIPCDRYQAEQMLQVLELVVAGHGGRIGC